MPSLSRISPFSILIIFLIPTAIGFGLIFHLPLQWTPQKKSTSISIHINWPDASPSVIDQEINLPVEGIIQLTHGVKNVQTLTQAGQSFFKIDFDEETNIDQTRYELSARIQQLYQQFPPTVIAPVIRVNMAQHSNSRAPLLVYSLSGGMTTDVLSKYAQNKIIPALSSVEGIQELTLIGTQQKEWQITLDSDKMALASISIASVKKAIQEYIESTSIGTVETNKHRINVSIQGNALRYSQDIGAIPIMKNESRLLLLKDIAHIQSGIQKAQTHYRLNGQSAVRILVFPKADANLLKTASRLKAEVLQLRESFPKNYSIQLDQDASDYIKNELNKILRRSLYALSLLSILLFLSYRKWQEICYLLVCLTINMGISCLFYFLFSIPLHIYALAGITVSFGLIIDNVLVMLQHWKQYQNRKVFPALLASTLTTMAALLSIFFLPAQWKINLEAFAQVIIINLTVSLLTSTVFLPALIQLFTSTPSPAKGLYRKLRKQALFWQWYGRAILFLQARKKMVQWMLLLLFGLPMFLLPPKLGHAEWYNKSLGNTFFLENIKPVLGGSLGLFLKKIRLQGNFFKSLEETKITIHAKLNPGHKLEHLDDIFTQLEAFLAQQSEPIESYSTHLQNGQLGYMHIHFKDEIPRHFPPQLKVQLESFCKNMANVEWSIRGLGRGFSQGSNFNTTSYRLQMRGYHRQKLKKQAQQLADQLLKNPRIKTVNLNANANWQDNERYQYQMFLDKHKLALHEFSPAFVKTLLKDFSQSPYASFQTADGQFIQLKTTDQLKRAYWHLDHQQVQQDSSQFILGQLGRIEKESVKSQIFKENQEYIQYLDFDFIGPYKIGDEYINQCLEDTRLQLPTGFSVKQQKGLPRELNKQWFVLPMIYLLIYFICASTLESFYQAKKIILLIWFSYIGIFLCFGLFNLPIDQGIYTAFMLMSGLVVNALILLFNEYNQLALQFPKLSANKIYIKSLRRKLKPILLSMATTIFGLLPFIYEGKSSVFWFNLGVGTSSGLLFSFMLILFYTPLQKGFNKKYF